IRRSVSTLRQPRAFAPAPSGAPTLPGSGEPCSKPRSRPGAPFWFAARPSRSLPTGRACGTGWTASGINRDVLGWNVAPHIVLLRIQDRLVAFPSNASMGEFGFAVQLDLSPRILGVATW